MKKIYLTGIRAKGRYALVDDEDFERCSEKKWYMSHLGRPKAMQKIGNKWHQIFMHRFILGVYDDRMVDHKNRDPLDNRKENLRFCTHSENQANSPPKNGRKYKGVVRDRGAWRARIKLNGKDIHVGSFRSQIAAAKAYNEAAVKYFGEFAWLNPV